MSAKCRRVFPVNSMSESRRAKVWVSQPLFDDVVAQLGEHFELITTARVTAYSPADLAAQLASLMVR